MSSYIIKVKNTSGTEGTVIADAGFKYSDDLNEVNNGKLKISGSSVNKRGLFEVGSEVYIYRNGTLEFHGFMNSLSYLDAGGIAADLNGYEIWLAKENGTYSSSPYSSTASATIAGDIIGESNYFTAGTTETGANIDFRISEGDSLYNALKRLIKRVGQDIGIDYTNSEVDILDHKGSSTSVATLNDGIQIRDVVARKSYPIANYVKIYGKGDGDTQIKSTSGHGQDATSQSDYGTITKIVREPTIMSEDEANELADKLVAKYKDPAKVYEFEVINPNLSVECGDVLKLNSQTKGLDNESVRIVGIERGISGNQEFLNLEVTNTAYSEKTKDINKKIAELENDAKRKDSFMQGTSNVLTFGEMINANNTAPLRVFAYLPSGFIEDEAGNNRVSSFTLDYDVDPFRSSVGSASEDNVAPGLEGGSTDSHKHDATDSGHTHSGGDTDSHGHNPSDSGHNHGNPNETSSATYTGDFEGSDTGSSVSCSSGSWTAVASEYVGSADNTNVSFYIAGDSGGAEDIMIKIYNDGIASSNWAEFGIYQDGFRDDSFVEMHGIWGGPCSGDTISLEVMPLTGAIDLDGWISVNEAEHTHTVNIGNTDSGNASVSDNNRSPGLNVSNANANVSDSNKTPGLSGNAASHNHNVSVGDEVSDAGSLNATELSEIKLYFYNTGTSTWDLKHTITNTGKTLDTDVDISDSGTYPDASGSWKVEIKTDNASPDLVQGVIKCKHQIDN